MHAAWLKSVFRLSGKIKFALDFYHAIERDSINLLVVQNFI